MKPTIPRKRRRSDASDDPNEVDKNQEPMAKKRNRGKPKGAQMFNSHDVNRLLDVLAEVLPIGEDMWDKVEATYNNRAEAATRESRDAEFLKRRYTDLIKIRKPRGNPQRLSNIAWAHEIEAAIEKQIQMSTLNDDEEYESYVEEESGSEDSESNIIGSDSDEEMRYERVQAAKAIREQAATLEKPKNSSAVKRLRTPRDAVKQQINERGGLLENSSTAFQDTGSSSNLDIDGVPEKVGMVQVLGRLLVQNHERSLGMDGRYDKLQDRMDRLQKKHEVTLAQKRRLELKVTAFEAQRTI